MLICQQSDATLLRTRKLEFIYMCLVSSSKASKKIITGCGWCVFGCARERADHGVIIRVTKERNRIPTAVSLMLYTHVTQKVSMR